MKLMTAFIVFAMLCMVFAGCGKLGVHGQPVGEKVDQVLDRTTLALADVGDSMGSTMSEAAFTVSGMAESISDSALLSTLDVTDAAITASIRTGLVRDPDLKRAKIDVESRDGVVSLRGVADHERTRERAEQIARRNKSVVEVRNHMAVTGT